MTVPPFYNWNNQLCETVFLQLSKIVFEMRKKNKKMIDSLNKRVNLNLIWIIAGMKDIK